jgi:hypothetical protein
MHHLRTVLSVCGALGLLVALGACGPAPETATGPEGAADGGSEGVTVAFTEPADGATVTSPVRVCLEATGVAIQPAGTLEPAGGHHHVIVDPSPEEAAAITAGGSAAAIAKDETHFHWGDAATCGELTLAPGEHTLLAVVADGNHIPLDPPATSSVVVTVE